MPDITVSANVNTLLQSANFAAFLALLGGMSIAQIQTITGKKTFDSGKLEATDPIFPGTPVINGFTFQQEGNIQIQGSFVVGGNLEIASTFQCLGAFSADNNVEINGAFTTGGTFSTADNFSTADTFSTGGIFITIGDFSTEGNFATKGNATVGPAGSFSVTGTATTAFVITIGTTMDDSAYKVGLTPTSLVAAAPFYISAKTTTTFTVTYLSGLTGAVAFDWQVTP